MFPNELCGALACAAGSSRIKALRMIDTEDGFTSETAELRKAAHNALTACRFIDTWRRLSGEAEFTDFDGTVRSIYKMDRTGEFRPGSIEDICESIRFWQAGKQRPAWV